MRISKWPTLVLFFILTAGFPGCGKEERKGDASNAKKQIDDSATAEAEKKKRVMAELLTEQQFLDLKVKAAAQRLEKQGNKTRKKLKPGFASLDSQKATLSSSLEKLHALTEPGFTEESNALRARQDSLSKVLALLEKSMK